MTNVNGHVPITHSITTIGRTAVGTHIVGRYDTLPDIFKFKHHTCTSCIDRKRRTVSDRITVRWHDGKGRNLPIDFDARILRLVDRVVLDHDPRSKSPQDTVVQRWEILFTS